MTTPNNNRCGRRRWSRLRALCNVTALALLGVIVATPFNMGGCSIAQITQTAQLAHEGLQSVTLSKEQEIPLGESAVCAITSRYPLWENEAANRYVNLVGLTVASNCSRQDVAFSFVVLDTDEVNAFSTPGGFVMVTRGALMQMSDESELAGVLGHEIGHVALGHGMKETSLAMQKEVARKAFSMTSDKYKQFGVLAGATANVILNQGWTQPEEFEADEQAVQLVIKANYDPAGFERFLGKLNSTGGSLMSTHPGKAERLARVTKQIDASGARGKGQTLADRFAANLKLR